MNPSPVNPDWHEHVYPSVSNCPGDRSVHVPYAASHSLSASEEHSSISEREVLNQNYF